MQNLRSLGRPRGAGGVHQERNILGTDRDAQVPIGRLPGQQFHQIHRRDHVLDSRSHRNLRIAGIEDHPHLSAGIRQMVADLLLLEHGVERDQDRAAFPRAQFGDRELRVIL